MSFLLLPVFSDDDHYDADMDMAVIELTQDLAKLVLARRKAFLLLKEKDSTLLEFTFLGAARFYEHSKVTMQIRDCGDLEEEFMGAGLTQDTDPFEGTGQLPARSEWSHMVVTDDSVQWAMCPKHCTTIITTTDVPMSKFEKYLNGGPTNGA